jgi:hypothetical protein
LVIVFPLAWFHLVSEASLSRTNPSASRRRGRARSEGAATRFGPCSDCFDCSDCADATERSARFDRPDAKFRAMIGGSFSSTRRGLVS